LRGKVEAKYAKKQLTPFNKIVLNESKIEEQLTAVEPGKIGLYQYDESTVFAVKLPNAETKPAIVQANFEYVVGCFSDERNAHNFVQKLQADGFNAHILLGGTLIRVSAGSAANQSEIQAIQSKISSKGMEGWICKL
jgi:cell division protein FtsN